MRVEDTTIEWFGTATFRVRHGGLELFFDAYLDRLPGLVPVGISTAQVESADFVFVSHAHFDHLYGADAIAVRTGATVVASPESARLLRASGCRTINSWSSPAAKPSTAGRQLGSASCRRCTPACSQNPFSTRGLLVWVTSTSARRSGS